ncbi:MAG: thiamine phosphate synthase [Ignavibacteria bacterium]
MRSDPGFRLLFITDRKLCREDSLEYIIKSACRHGVKAIQLREKDLLAKELLNLAIRIRKITNIYSSKLIINDRLDIALLSHADGLHCPQDGVSYKSVKKFNSKFLVGKSVHSIEEAFKADKDGYDYLIFGPVFRTLSKIKYGKPTGLKELYKVARSVKVPVYAIGGINPDRAKSCIANGAHGIAVVRFLMRADKIKKTIDEFKIALGEL